jgi:hypothetical protein
VTGNRRDIREAEKRAPLEASVRVDDEPTASDRAAVAHLLGREPQGAYRVVVRNARTRWPVVIRNHPILPDGTPMPTRYWLVGEPERTMVSRLESRGGVHRVEDEVGMDVIAAAHDVYAAERDAEIPADWHGPRPTGGVGGTRVGVKCLHAHYGWWLAGGDDPVGQWVADHLAAGDGDPAPPA